MRRHIVEDKKSGQTDVWFDSRTGQMIRRPQEAETTREAKGTCPYCGFSLRFEDRFCPYCGAPIKG